LCKPRLRLGVHDWVLSLEVGEHLPDDCLARYVDLLANSARQGVVLAWSAMTSGHCHVNIRGSGTLACMLFYYGFRRDESASFHARRSASIGWLRKDVRVYVRKELG